MKRIFLLVGVLAISLLSCQKENENLTFKKANQSTSFLAISPEVENFKEAINKMNQPKYLPTKEYTEKYGNELSDEKKQILLEPAKELIFSTGIDEHTLQRKYNNDIDNILNKAFEIYILQTSKK